MDTKTAIDVFVRAKTAEGLSDQTLASYGYRLKRFGNWFPESLPAEIPAIEEFLVDTASTPENAETYWRLLKNIYGFLNRRELIDFNPIEDIPRPKIPRKIARQFTRKELKKILTYENHRDHDRAFLWLLADTGIRIGEALSVTEASYEDGFLHVTGKTGERIVPVSNQVWENVRAELPWKWNTRPSASIGVRRAIHAAGVGGAKASAHTLRHTFCRTWNGDESILVEILGWTSPRMLKVYRPFNKDRAKSQHDTFSVSKSYQQPYLF